MKNSGKHMAGQEKFAEVDCGKLLYYQDPFYVKEAYRSARADATELGGRLIAT